MAGMEGRTPPVPPSSAAKALDAITVVEPTVAAHAADSQPIQTMNADADRHEQQYGEGEGSASGGKEAPELALPAPGDGEGEGAAPTTVEINGKPVKLDKLGPMVVGRDGTLSRISNWGEMNAIERQNTLRVLGKRNQLRLGALRATAAEVGGVENKE